MRARKKFGQHFLEAAWAEKVVAVIAPQRSDRFLEIGPGPGALTLRLAPRVAHITAVELDAAMVAALAPRLPPNVDLIRQDFLQFDVGSLVQHAPVRVAGNLPYNVSSPILFRLLDAYRQTGRLLDASLMLQLEVAERIEAAPGTRDYGVLAILVQFCADVRRLLTLPAGAFRPMPKVRSAVVGLRFRPSEHEVRDVRLLETLVRTIFTQRRKTLLNAMRPFAEPRGRHPGLVLEEAGIDSRRRPETLTLAEIARLARLFGSPQT
ncbi:MAG: 16S rRNA (adenine(1518)-N(6)/adenine(1519)-N(6))-dimethyltransferase RsmA [Vicinamibacterales bacterium]